MEIQPYMKLYMEYHGISDIDQVKNWEYISWITKKHTEFQKIEKKSDQYVEHFTQWLRAGKDEGPENIVIINPDGTRYVMPMPNQGMYLGRGVDEKTVIGSRIYHNGDLMATVEESTQEELDRWKR